MFPAGCPAKYTANGSFRPLAGCGLFPVGSKTDLERLRFRPLAGVGCFCDKRCEACQYPEFPSPCGVWVVSSLCTYRFQGAWFPSPCGVWVVSSGCKLRHGLSGVSVPLRGVGCFESLWPADLGRGVSVPLRGVGCFGSQRHSASSSGVSVPLRGVGCFYAKHLILAIHNEFPSPCGVWVVSVIGVPDSPYGSFRPLAGCGLFHEYCNRQSCPIWVSVPLRGVGCFECQSEYFRRLASFRPLAGCGLFPNNNGMDV